jgi:hypothetical protein
MSMYRRPDGQYLSDEMDDSAIMSMCRRAALADVFEEVYGSGKVRHSLVDDLNDQSPENVKALGKYKELMDVWLRSRKDKEMRVVMRFAVVPGDGEFDAELLYGDEKPFFTTMKDDDLWFEIAEGIRTALDGVNNTRKIEYGSKAIAYSDIIRKVVVLADFR